MILAVMTRVFIRSCLIALNSFAEARTEVCFTGVLLADKFSRNVFAVSFVAVVIVSAMTMGNFVRCCAASSFSFFVFFGISA